MLEHNIPIFVEDETRKNTVNEDEAYNFLLEGNNIHSLKLLGKTHKGKIDVIYIEMIIPKLIQFNDFKRAVA